MQAVDLWVEGPSLSDPWIGICTVAVLCHDNHSEVLGGGRGTGSVACRSIVDAGGGDVVVVVVVVVVDMDHR